MQDALTLYRQIGERQLEADTLEQLGYAYFSLSQFQQAIETFQQALSIYRHTGNRQKEEKVLIFLNMAIKDREQQIEENVLQLIEETARDNGQHFYSMLIS